jgi:hypothetical protein
MPDGDVPVVEVGSLGDRSPEPVVEEELDEEALRLTAYVLMWLATKKLPRQPRKSTSFSYLFSMCVCVSRSTTNIVEA